MIYIPSAILAIEDENDKDFMTSIYLELNRLMYKEAKNIINNQWAAEDIIQNVIIKLIGKISLLKTMGKARYTSYVITSVRNEARNYIRKNSKVQVSGFDDLLETQVPDLGESIEERIIKDITVDELNAVWNLMPDETREILERRYILEQSDKEIADACGVKAGSVRMMLTRARRAILAKLSTSRVN